MANRTKNIKSRLTSYAGIALVACTLLLSLFFSSFRHPDNEVTEYKLKAAFIYNFIQYIDWGSAAPAGSGEFVIGILGPSPIEQPLREIALTRTEHDKRIAIRHFNSPEEITGCHILFIAKDAGYPLETILAKTAKGTLTVSERQGYCRKGTAINFVVVDNKIKFESNLKALSAAGLKASSQLLKLAIISG
jgi:hypothetical protein